MADATDKPDSTTSETGAPAETPAAPMAGQDAPEGGDQDDTNTGEDTPEEADEAPPAGGDAPDGADEAPVSARAGRLARAAARDLPHVMTRIFNTPLMIASDKLDVILSVLGPRLGLTPGRSLDFAAPQIAGFFDDDGDAPDGDDTPYDITADGIALVTVAGTLVYKSSWLGAMSGMTSYASVQDAVAHAVANPAVRGILMQVDSNGGEVNGCFDTSDALFAMRAEKPIYGVAADNAFSAAYAILSAASKVFVSRTSGVGSISTVAVHVDQSGADQMKGLNYTYVTPDKAKTDFNPHEPLSDPARAVLSAELARSKALFVASVAKYRGLSAEAVDGTHAAIYFGENGVSAGLADAVGTPADALNALRADISVRETAAAANMLVPSAESADLPATVAAADLPAASAGVAVTPGSVVNLDDVRAVARGEAATRHAEIVSLCVAAGLADRASDFIGKGISLAAVRNSLQDIRAAVSDAQNIQGHILPDAGDGSAQASATGWEKAIIAQRGGLRQN